MTLDHKWRARNTLLNARDLSPQEYNRLMDIATSAFIYYDRHYQTLKSDKSLSAITELCSNSEHELDIELTDETVFHLSNVFNEIVNSTRKLKKCYDCGTNARAIFMSLIKAHRGGYVSYDEHLKMRKEYIVKRVNVLENIDKCFYALEQAESDTVFIMSVAISGFGHVWVIEKRFISGQPRYHHYQSCLNSHLLLDFIEYKDYGRNPQQSLDIADFRDKLKQILSVKTEWGDQTYRLFEELFQFSPVTDVIFPDPGFSYTSVTYSDS